MKSESFVIIERLDSGVGEITSSAWVNVLTHDHRQVTFWGSINPISLRNIKAIEQQDLPFIVEITDAKENPDHKKNYGTDISVDEGCAVVVHPFPVHLVRILISPENIDSLQHQLEQISVFRAITEEG